MINKKYITYLEFLSIPIILIFGSLLIYLFGIETTTEGDDFVIEIIAPDDLECQRDEK